MAEGGETGREETDLDFTTAGRTRLRKVAKQCTNYGRRVQNSVFECILDSAQSVALKGILSDIIDKNKDSLRFYYLGN